MYDALIPFWSLRTVYHHMNGEHDDEYTFISCDSESMFGMSESILGMSLSSIFDDPRHYSPRSDLPTCDDTDDRLTRSGGEKLDFQATKGKLESALGRRTARGKLVPERMDYTRRKLRYELNRKMIKERFNSMLMLSPDGR